MTKPDVILHIGYPKTGSSTLQKFFHDNSFLLDEHGFHYARRSYTEQFGNADDIYQLNRPGLNKSKLKKILDRDIDTCKDKTLLYSQELLFYLEPGFYSYLKSYFNRVQVIIYLRRQDKWLESYKKWQIAAGEPLSDDKKIIPYTLADYSKFLIKIESVLGKENIIVRPFEKKQFFKENLCYDFLNSLGIDSSLFSKYSFAEKTLNESFEGKALAYKNLLNGYLENKMYKVKGSEREFGPWKGLHINKVLAKYSKENKSKNFEIISPKDKAKILKDFDVGNKEIAENYLGIKNGELFKESPPKTDKAYTGMDELSLDDIKDISSYVFNEILNVSAKTDREYAVLNVALALNSMYDMYNYSDDTQEDKRYREKVKTEHLEKTMPKKGNGRLVKRVLSRLGL